MKNKQDRSKFDEMNKKINEMKSKYGDNSSYDNGRKIVLIPMNKMQLIQRKVICF